MNNMPFISPDQLQAYNAWAQKILNRMLKAVDLEEEREILETMFNQHPEWIEAFKHDYNHTVEFFEQGR